MNVDGSCHCGAIAYEAELADGGVGICHCSDCQTLSGSAFRTIALTRPGGFRVTKGTPKEYVKIADSGAVRPQAFCADCGSPIYSTSTEPEPRVYAIRAGTLSQRAELEPTFQIWTRSAHDWLHTVPGLPGHAKGPA